MRRASRRRAAIADPSALHALFEQALVGCHEVGHVGLNSVALSFGERASHETGGLEKILVPIRANRGQAAVLVHTWACRRGFIKSSQVLRKAHHQARVSRAASQAGCEHAVIR